MDIRNSANPVDVRKYYDTEALRKEFLIEGLFAADSIPMVYSHVDRMITGSACPVASSLRLECGPELGVDFFLQRREMGVINIGGKAPEAQPWSTRSSIRLCRLGANGCSRPSTANRPMALMVKRRSENVVASHGAKAMAETEAAL